MQISSVEEFEKRISHLSDTTKIYIRAQMALAERYLLLMLNANANDDTVPLLRKMHDEEAEAMYMAYAKERVDQDLLPEVGHVICGPRP